MPFRTYTISIAAPASKGWSFLGNFDTYSAWNPYFFAVRADQPYASGMVLHVDQKWGNKDCLDDKITLTVYDPATMSWQMHFANNILAQASYVVRVKPQRGRVCRCRDGGARRRHHEDCSTFGEEELRYELPCDAAGVEGGCREGALSQVVHAFSVTPYMTDRVLLST
jgi:hypothetical protein